MRHSAESLERLAQKSEATKALKLAYFKAHGTPLGDETDDWRGPCQLAGCQTLMSCSEAHHKIKRSAGGEDSPENRILLCPLCHAKAHSSRTIFLEIKAHTANMANGEIIGAGRERRP